jgi:type IV secretion system protein VirD4
MLTSLILFAYYRQGKDSVGIDDVRYYLNQMACAPQSVYQQVSHCKVPEVANTASALDAEPRVLRSIVSTAQSAMDNLISREALSSLSSQRAIDLQQVVDGGPFSLYLVIPPHLLSSCATLLRLWLVTLFQAVYSRTSTPAMETLFLMDEAAQLGPLEELRQAITLMRGYGVRSWTFWQDLSQLKRLYPLDWQSLVNNSLTLQVFGAHTGMAQQELLDVLGCFSRRELHELADDEQLLLQRGYPAICEKLSYLKCPVLLERSQRAWRSRQKETLRLVDV